jgi:DNA-binding transcriptional MerR regulator
VPEIEASYAIGDLATLGDVSRRTVRYYVQEGLLPPPAGLGRGNHYGPAHLSALLRVKAMQEAGHTLDEIRSALSAAHRPTSARRAPDAESAGTPLPRSLYRRVSLAEGIELHVDGTRGLPSTAALRELAEWCHRHFGSIRPSTEEGE